MTFGNLLNELAKRSIQLKRDGDQIKFRGNENVIDSSIRENIRFYKSELLEWLFEKTDTWYTPRLTIRPEQLSLITLTQEDIDRVVEITPGGVGNIKDIYPLAPLQEGLLFHHLIGEEKDAYVLNSFWAFDNRELLDKFILSFQSVINRHDILRTAILWEDLPEPIQVVWRNTKIPVEEVFIDSSEGSVADQMLERYSGGKVRIDIQKAPMVRVFIAKDNNNERWILTLLFHHLIMDHTTLELLFQEVGAYIRGEESILPEALPFRNYIAQARLGGSQAEHEAFFKGMLSDVEEPTAPYGILDVIGEGTDIEEAWYSIDIILSRRLRECARRLRVSAASLFHLAWARVVGSLSNRDDVVFGTVLFGRMQGGEGAERVLGMFTNTLPVRIEVKDDGVEEAVKKTHCLLTDLLHHEHATLTLAQRCSGVVAPMPLFSSLLNYRYLNTGPVEEKNKGYGMGIEWLYGEEITNYPFSLSVNDLGEGFSLTVQTQRHIDPNQVCMYMNTALEHLVDALENTPQLALGNVGVLSVTELNQLLYKWNDTDIKYPQGKCIHELFEEQVEKTPDAVAVVFEDRQISYEELNIRANQLAHYLAGIGVEPDNPVGICLDRSLEMVIGLYGIIKAGGAYVPFDPQYPDNRLLYMLSQSKVTTVLTQKNSGSRFSEIISEDLSDNKAKLICLDSDWDVISKEEKEAPGIAISDKNLAYVIYTSGSTGNPKGVMTSHQGIRNRLLWMQDEYQLNDIDCILQKTTFCFDDSVIEFFWPLITGAKLVVAIPEGHKDSKYLVKTVIEQGVTTLQFVPSMLKIFIEDEGVKGCNTLKRVICSGEALPYELQKQYYSVINTTLNNLYGPTEASVDVTYWACKKNDSNGIVYIGRPMSNTQVYITDAQMNPVPVKVPGELHVGGIQLSRGYIYRPDITAEKFIPNLFHSESGQRLYKTGDLARYFEDGNIAYINRIDNQIKIRGFRIELGEIESCLREIEKIKEAVVVTREDIPGEKRLVAYYTVFEDREKITVEDIRINLSSHLPDYMVPSAYVLLEEIPLAPNGKTDRKALPVPDGDAYARGVYEAPVGEVEEALAGIWSEMLNIEQVGRNDNFFNLGGHSLLATQVISRIRKVFQVDLPMRSMFEAQRIVELGVEIERRLWAKNNMDSDNPYEGSEIEEEVI